MRRLAATAAAAIAVLAVAPAAWSVTTAPPSPAQRELGRFALSVLAFADDHHGRFTGMTRASLRRYDATLDPLVRVGRVTGSTFCIDMRFEGVPVQLGGTANDFAPAFGRC